MSTLVIVIIVFAVLVLIGKYVFNNDSVATPSENTDMPEVKVNPNLIPVPATVKKTVKKVAAKKVVKKAKK